MIGTQTQDDVGPASYIFERGNSALRSPQSQTHVATMLAGPLTDTLAMPTRFHFHLVREHERIVDPTGVELRDDVVHSPAIFDAVKKIWPGIAESTEWLGWSIEVTDSDGRIVRTITLL
jgi:hypothetical protein